jgi:hypothetical protein
MAFDFSYVDNPSNAQKNTSPIVKLYNMARTAQTSYISLNKAAIEALNINESKMVRVGIDKETKKIVIIASNNERGRKLSLNPSGSGSISVKNLIEENHIPTQVCTASINRNYGGGGLIFTYTL